MALGAAVAAIVFAAMLAIPTMAAAGMGVVFDGRVMPRVSVAGVDVGLLTAAEAGERLRAELPNLAVGDLAITVDGSTTTIPVSRVGRAHDVDALVAAAMAVGRLGNAWEDGQARLATLVMGANVVDEVALDQDRFDRLVIETATGAFVAPVNGAVVTNPDGTYSIQTPAVGHRLDPDQIRTALSAALLQPGARNPAVIFESEPIPFVVTQREAAEAAAAARAMFATPLNLSDGDDAYAVAPAAIQSAISFGTVADEGYGVLLDRTALSAAAAALGEAIRRDPTDAAFTFGAAGPTGVKPAVRGRDLDVTATVNAIVAGLEQRGAGIAVPSVALSASFVEPTLTTAAAQEMLPRLIRLSTWTTYYVPAAGNGWGNNISIPARDLDGMVILPNEDFDFWRDIGPVTFERGYSYGGAIIGGRSTGDQAIGGGICSTSTTLFNTALRAGLAMNSRANHYYYIDRYPMGLDATVFATDYYSQTMSFTNDTESPLMIRSYASPGVVRFDLWGLPLNRTVSFTNPITWNPTFGHDTVEYTAALPKGVSQRVEYIHNGFSVSVTRRVTDNATGELIHDDTYVSHYQTVNGVVQVGTR
jgi:vancomycin resistance protein YoaR